MINNSIKIYDFQIKNIKIIKNIEDINIIAIYYIKRFNFFEIDSKFQSIITSNAKKI